MQFGDSTHLSTVLHNNSIVRLCSRAENSRHTGRRVKGKREEIYAIRPQTRKYRPAYYSLELHVDICYRARDVVGATEATV